MYPYDFGMMRANSLSELSEELIWSLDANDEHGFHEALRRLAVATPQAHPEDVQDAVDRLTQILATIPFWKGTDLVKVVGSMTDYCSNITGLLGVLAQRVTMVMELSERFAATLGDAALPDPGDPNSYQPAVGLLLDVLTQPGHSSLPGILDLPALPDDRAHALAEAWFTCGAWVHPLLYLSQRADVRAMLPGRDRLLAATEAIRAHIGTADWLYGLLLVLDDEVLLVLHRATGYGYRVTIGGIGDNFQLHTLLAATLIGKKSRGLIPGKGPSPAEVAAASDGPDLLPPGGIRGIFTLVDAYGNQIYNEGRPADIPRLEGIRVVVLDPPSYAQAWNAGRTYPSMRPALEVTEVLNQHSAAYWLSKVKPPTGR
jgi:hypothetical protein